MYVPCGRAARCPSLEGPARHKVKNLPPLSRLNELLFFSSNCSSIACCPIFFSSFFRNLDQNALCASSLSKTIRSSRVPSQNICGLRALQWILRPTAKREKNLPPTARTAMKRRLFFQNYLRVHRRVWNHARGICVRDLPQHQNIRARKARRASG